MKEEFLRDPHRSALIGKAIQEGKYVVACGIQSQEIQPDVDLETPFVIACSEKQGRALFEGQPFAGKMYSITGTHYVTGTANNFNVSLQRTNERITTEWVAPFRYEGEWKNGKSKGTVVLEILLEQEA